MARSLRLGVVAALLPVLALTACGDAEPDLGEAAKDGLVVYSGRNEKLIGPLLEDFEKASGTKVTVRYGDSAELAATLLEEGDKTPASVFLSQDAGALGALEEAGRLAPVDAALLAKVDRRYRSTQGLWVGVSGRSRVLAFNTEQVRHADLPASVLDLTKPQYKGKVGYVPTNASFQAFVTALRVTLGDAKAKEFLVAFKDNGPKAYDSNARLAEAVDKGEVPLALLNHYYLYERADEIGGYDQLKAHNHYFKAGDPGALVNVAGVGVLKGQADARTQQLLEFLLGTEAQTYFGEKTHEYPLVKDVAPVGTDLPPLAALQGPDIDLADLRSLEETLALLDEVGLT